MSFGRRQSEGGAPARPAGPRRRPRNTGDDGKVVSFARSEEANGGAPSVSALAQQVVTAIEENGDTPDFSSLTRPQLAEFAGTAAASVLDKAWRGMNALEQRNLVTAIVNVLHTPGASAEPGANVSDTAEGAEPVNGTLATPDKSHTLVAPTDAPRKSVV